MKNNLPNQKNLPALFFFTDRKRFADIFLVIQNLPKGTAIIIREYDLPYPERLEFAQKIKKFSDKNLILVGKDPALALEIKADGVHFSDHDTSYRKYLSHKKFAKKNFLFSFACHRESSIKKAEKLEVDLIFYSPVFKTKSHPSQEAIGVLRLSKISLKSKIPLYALGGINSSNVKLLKNCKIAGIAGIEIFNKSSL